jgi:SAM-dependent methyltransferase
MHESVRLFVKQHAGDLVGPVLEVGSFDVNGTVRDLCPTPYTGCDILDGPGVDVVYDERDPLPFGYGQFGAVLCLEVFEHCWNPTWLASEICRVLQAGGSALVTARGVGFPFHNPPDRWRYMPGALAELFTRHHCDAVEEPDPQAPGWFVKVTR